MSKKKIKIVRVIARLNVGGPALHCTLLSKNLNQDPFRTVLVTGRTDSTEASFEEMKGVDLRGVSLVHLEKMGRVPNMLADLKSFFSLIKILRKEKPDIVHTHTAKAGVLGRLAAKICRVPVVVHTYHGHVLSGYFSPLNSKLIQWFERFLGKLSTALVTLSPSLQKELSSKFHVAPKEKFRVIPLGRDLDRFLNQPRNVGQLRKELGGYEGYLMGTVGRLVPIKNQSLILEACQQLPSTMDWKFVFVGEGPLLADLQKKADSLSLSQKVVFLGWRSDLENIYSDLDLFVLSSKNEGTPLSMIEAFASGCPVVSTKVGGIGDMFGEPIQTIEEGAQLFPEGILVEGASPDLLGRAMETLLKDSTLRKNCSDNCRRTGARYSERALTERMQSLYLELLDLVQGRARAFSN